MMRLNKPVTLDSWIVPNLKQEVCLSKPGGWVPIRQRPSRLLRLHSIVMLRHVDIFVGMYDIMQSARGLG